MIWGQKPTISGNTHIPGSSRYKNSAWIHRFTWCGSSRCRPQKQSWRGTRNVLEAVATVWKHSGSALLLDDDKPLSIKKWVKLVTTNLWKIKVGYVCIWCVHTFVGVYHHLSTLQVVPPNANPGEGWPSGLMQSSLPETHLPPSLLSLCVPWTPDFLSKKR